jgi:hypothetical protein
MEYVDYSCRQQLKFNFLHGQHPFKLKIGQQFCVAICCMLGFRPKVAGATICRTWYKINLAINVHIS